MENELHKAPDRADTTAQRSEIGVPYALVDEATGERICPACGDRIPEVLDATGEPTTNRYGEHFVREHGTPADVAHSMLAACPGAVRRFLDCSTMHLDAPEGMGLDALADGCEPVLAYAYAEGAWVHVPTDAEDFAARDWTGWENLRRVLETARCLDCDWVRIDVDGLELPGLPRFSW